MADVFSQLHIQVVFAVKNRQALILPEWEDQLYKYISGVIQTRGHKTLAINGMPDHIHIFFGLKPAVSISDLVGEIKTASNDYVKDQKLSSYKFDWQAGYGAFSYSKSHVEAVYNYILNQKEHNKSRTFETEFFKMLKDFEVEIGKKQMLDFFLPD